MNFKIGETFPRFFPTIRAEDDKYRASKQKKFLKTMKWSVST